jgi:uncharacterized integral membrane protein
MSLNSEVRLVAKPAAAKIPLIPKILIAILSGALLAAATAQALEMLHH